MENRSKLRRTLQVAGVLLLYAGLIHFPLGRTQPLQAFSVALILLMAMGIALTIAGQLASPLLTTRPAVTALLFLLHPAVYYVGLIRWPGQSRIDLWDALYAVLFCGIWL